MHAGSKRHGVVLWELSKGLKDTAIACPLCLTQEGQNVPIYETRLTEESVIAESSGSGSPEQIHPGSSIMLHIIRYFGAISCSYQTLDTHQIHTRL